MNTNFEKQMITVAEKNCGYGAEFTGGSLFVNFTNQLNADKCHIALQQATGKDTGVNMYSLNKGEFVEFVFDFVPKDREAPTYYDIPGDVETSLQLEIEAEQGR